MYKNFIHFIQKHEHSLFRISAGGPGLEGYHSQMFIKRMLGTVSVLQVDVLHNKESFKEKDHEIFCC